jgi:LysM repeat protein
MSPEATNSTTKVCPTCGTRLTENATRCLVCGRNFAPVDTSKSAKTVQSPHLPEFTLNLPIAIGLFILIFGIGAAAVYAVLTSPKSPLNKPTATVTTTITPTASATPSPTGTTTPLPTATTLPPTEYTVKQGDTCLLLAYTFNVSINSIVLLNDLDADCSTLSVGQKLLIPQPTPTASPMPTTTLGAPESTEAACEKADYTVASGDTLSGIARSYNVDAEAIKSYNGMKDDTVYQGMALKIPLCHRLPTSGPTPTATNPPPYAGPNLLLPADGAIYNNVNDTITLQWSSIGTLRTNESYAVTVEDITDGTGRKLTDYVTDTRYNVPAGFRPVSKEPHIIRWTVTTVRQSGTSQDGKPVWESAGVVSQPRVFSWWGSEAAPTTPTPESK